MIIKIWKKYDKKVEIMMKMMQKFPWILDKACLTYDFCKFEIKNEIKMKKKQHYSMGQGHAGWQFCNYPCHLLKHGRFGQEEEMFLLVGFKLNRDAVHAYVKQVWAAF